MSKELVPLNTELVADNAEIVDGEVVNEDTGLIVETFIDNGTYTRWIRVKVTEDWVRDAPREWIDELGMIRDALFELARRVPPGRI